MWLTFCYVKLGYMIIMLFIMLAKIPTPLVSEQQHHSYSIPAERVIAFPQSKVITNPVTIDQMYPISSLVQALQEIRKL